VIEKLRGSRKTRFEDPSQGNKKAWDYTMPSDIGWRKKEREQRFEEKHISG